jgi:hypothetical protein
VVGKKKQVIQIGRCNGMLLALEGPLIHKGFLAPWYKKLVARGEPTPILGFWDF